MKKIVTLILLILTSFELVKAQQDIREQVYVHLNTQMVIPGETLYLSAYCNSQKTGEPSVMSKVLYVEIVGKDGPVHQQKISLDNGRGHSDFFVSSMIPSGQYHLIAYTRWMKNFEDYFHCPVLIVNPYESYPDKQSNKETNIVFYPTEGSLIGEVDNVIGYHLISNTPSQYKGRIVNSDGKVISSFKPNKFGLGKLIFEPEKGKSYQVILEDSKGSISFYDLPDVEEGSQIAYKYDNGKVSLKCELAGKSTDTLNMSLHSNSGISYQSKVLPNAYHTIPEDGFPVEVGQVRYTDSNGELVAERMITLGNDDPEIHELNRVYSVRKQVSLKPDLEQGTYSISVRKKIVDFDEHHHAVRNNALNYLLTSPVSPYDYLSDRTGDLETLFLASEKRSLNPTPQTVSLLPEIREEILTGQINETTGGPANAQKVSLTLPGDPFQLRIGESDERGRFFIPFQSSASDTEAVVSALDQKNTYQIEVFSPFLDSYPDFDFQLPELDSSTVQEIIRRSIRVQIENAYFDLSQGTSISRRWIDGIPYETTYMLDNYQRFSTLKETFTEFILTANVRENRDYVVKTNYSPGLFKDTYPPLVLLDGVPVSGENVIETDPYKVESVSVLPNRYFLGPVAVDGIVGIKTFDNDYEGFSNELKGNHKKILVKKVSENLTYSFPDYSGNSQGHIADQRDQLYWNPDFQPESNNAEISFYASDVPGTYEVVIEGFTSNGNPISKVFDFTVK